MELDRSELARWTSLDAESRRRWILAAIDDAAVAAELRLTMALHAGAEPISRDWVAQAAKAQPSPAWWRPAIGVAAALGLVALWVDDRPSAPMATPAIAAVDSRPDEMGNMSFESEGDLFGGSFEAM